MSYNSYNQYSPYWQQTAGQTTPQNNGRHVGKLDNSFQPLSAYQNDQQPPKSSISQASGNSGSAYGNQGYGNVTMNGAGNGTLQDSRAGYTSTNDRASIDGATALGNLAYASRLGRDSSMQQVSNINQQQRNASYGITSSYGVGSGPPVQYRTGDERRDNNSASRDDNTKSQQATASPSFGYNANNVRYQGPSAGSNTQAQPQYSQSSRSSNEQHNNQYSQPSRPLSGQTMQQSHSRLGSQAAPSPTLLANQSTPNQVHSSRNSGSVRGNEPTKKHALQSKKPPPSSQGPRGPTQQPQVPRMAAKLPDESVTKGKSAADAPSKGTMATPIKEGHLAHTAGSRRDQASKPTTPVEPQYTTVDPSQVFNHVEYSRRQAAAAAEVAAVRKAAEEVEAAKFAATQPKVIKPQANGAQPDSTKKDQIELEMKQMIEKMRDYKAKDPSLFTQIWEQVKKDQPPQRALSQSLQGSTTSPVVVNGQSLSPSLILNQLPPESDLPAGDEFPSDFDRGRFPAQRRRRGGSTKVSTGRKSGTPKGSSEPADIPQTAEKHDSPVPPEIAIPTPRIGQIFPDPGVQSTDQAMRQYQQNSKSPAAKAQQIPEDNKQARKDPSMRPPGATTSTAPPSQPVPAQSAPPLKPGGTYWPESKKRALAEAARIALTSTPLNQGKPITTQEIHELLDQNPSYTQMCEILEYRGFVINRGQFARVLLKAVPDLGSASSPSNTASNTTASPISTATVSNNNSSTTTKVNTNTPPLGSYGVLVTATSKGPAAQPKMHHPVPYSVSPATALQATNTYATPYASFPPGALQASEVNQRVGLPRDHPFARDASWTPNGLRHPAIVTSQAQPFPLHQNPGLMNGQVLDQEELIPLNGIIPHHPTKQELARKRTFGEIVDLTQTLSDDEELERRGPKFRLDNEGASGLSWSVKNNLNQVAQRQQTSGRSTPKPFKYKQSGRDALLQSRDIIEPINKRRDALRRSTYNSKTIARDVLLSIGKHPAMAPLNAHLDGLKDKFKAVDYESDLSTFRWDLVDPEGEISAAFPDSDEEEAVTAIAAAASQRPAPIAVMIDGDGGDKAKDDHATRMMNSRQKSHKRGPYKKTKVGSGLKPLGFPDIPQQQPSQGSPRAQIVGNAPSASTPDLSRFAYDSPNTAQTNLATLNASNSNTPATVSKRKGRPPGAKNKQVRPDKGTTKMTKIHSEVKAPPTAEAKPKPSDEETIGNEPLVERSSPFGSFAIGKTSTPIRTKPRPNTATPSRPRTDGIAVIIPSRSPSVVVVTPQASAKKGSPKKLEDFSQSTHSSMPLYTIYRCCWENCPAELHNIETLKKHIKKHRRAVDDVYPCLWAECSDSSNPISSNTQNEDSQHRRLIFKTDAEWIKHVESNHINPEEQFSVTTNHSDVKPSDQLREDE